MRTIVWLVAVAVVAAEIAEEPWVEEEDLEEPYNDYHDVRSKSDFEEYDGKIREKRCEHGEREKRSSDYIRSPRQVHQYEVHEAFEDVAAPSPLYEEMLAASAEHYHKVYAPAPRARQLRPEVSAGPLTFGVHPPDPIQVVAAPAHVGSPLVSPNVGEISVGRDEGLGHAVVGQGLTVAEDAALTGLSEDSAPAAGHHQHVQRPQAHSHTQGGGHQQHAAHHGLQGGKTSKGSASDHYVNKGGKGHKTDELHKKQYEEAAGKKKKHHDHAGHKGSHEEEAHGHRGAHFDEKKGHKKGHKTKGFHNKYHKDEFHKEHKFYDDYHKSGEHHRYGKFNAKHASNESGKKKAHHVNAGHDFVERGKKGYSNKGHVDADHKGHHGKHGHEEHHEHHSEHGKKGGKEGGSHWGYAKKN